jgi:hypothetical protein
MKALKNEIADGLIHVIHNLIWHRITREDQYLKMIPEIDTKYFHNWIYFIDYQFIEYDDRVIHAVLHLNGKYYQNENYPDFMNSVSVHEIADSEVEAKIIEFRGRLWEGIEMFVDDQWVRWNETIPIEEFVSLCLSCNQKGKSMSYTKKIGS